MEYNPSEDDNPRWLGNEDRGLSPDIREQVAYAEATLPVVRSAWDCVQHPGWEHIVRFVQEELRKKKDLALTAPSMEHLAAIRAEARVYEWIIGLPDQLQREREELAAFIEQTKEISGDAGEE